MRQDITDTLYVIGGLCAVVAGGTAGVAFIIGMILGIIALTKALGVNTGPGYVAFIFVLCTIVAGTCYAIIHRLEQ